MEFEHLDKFMEEISKLRKAHELLEKVCLSFGTYALRIHLEDYGISEVAREIEKYFGFDDSE